MRTTNYNGGVRGEFLWCDGWIAKVRGITVVLFKRGSVGHRRQVSWITDRLSSNKWPTNHLRMRWRVTVAEGYEWVTWRLSIRGKIHIKGISTNERGVGTDNSYGTWLTREKWKVTSSGDNGKSDSRRWWNSGPFKWCHVQRGARQREDSISDPPPFD
jgi:hypothetical protein